VFSLYNICLKICHWRRIQSDITIMYIGIHAHYSSRILLRLEFSRQIFEKYYNAKFHENSSSESRVLPFGQTEIHDETVTFRNFANAYIKTTHSAHEQSLTVRVFNTSPNTRCSPYNCGVAGQARSTLCNMLSMKPLHNTSSVGMKMTTRLHCLLKWHDYLCACNMQLQCTVAACHGSKDFG